MAWSVLLLTLTSWPKPPQVPGLTEIPYFDKLVHFGLYAGEAFFLYASVAWPGRAVFSLARALAVAGTMAAWGVADEVHQHWIPGRSMEGEDVLAEDRFPDPGATDPTLGNRVSTVGPCGQVRELGGGEDLRPVARHHDVA